MEGNSLTSDELLNEYMVKEGLLLGHLFIVFENDLTDLEASFLKGLQRLTKDNEDYLKAFHVQAKSMEVLNACRATMQTEWKQLSDMAKAIETDEKNRRPTFSFDVALTRDGILLLKDVTNEEYRNYFAAPGTADDYRQNIPVHRLFKIAMNCLKYLFHSNYHHNEEHDTYLPSSNLYPEKEGGTLDLQRVFKHQLDAFFVPVIKLKRKAFSNHTVESYGVLLYAKAFIRVFAANELVSSVEAGKAKDFCEILEKEVTEMTAQQRTLVNALITNHNPFVILSGLLAFVFTCLKLLSIFVDIPRAVKVNGFSQVDIIDEKMLMFDMVIVALLAITGYAIYIIPRSRILSRQFKPKQKPKNWWYQNSSLRRKKFSYPYMLHILYHTIKLQIKGSLYAGMVTTFYLFCLLVAFYALVKIIQ